MTAQVSAAVKDNKLTITASNDAFGDPAQNMVKQLRVDYLEGDDRQFRPVLSLQGDAGREMWLIDGQPRGFRFPTLSEQELRRRSEQSGRDVVTALAARESDWATSSEVTGSPSENRAPLRKRTVMR